MQSINPATGAIIHDYTSISNGEAARIVDAAQAAFTQWRTLTYRRRAELLCAAAGRLRADKRRYAECITVEMGKPLAQAIAEIDKCAAVCDFYAEHGEALLADEPVHTNGRHSFVSYQPIGVVLAVMPWNFPFWQVFRFATPALMAGNVALLKHAPNVCGAALLIEAIFRDAGFPDNVFRTLLLDTEQVAAVIAHRHVRAVTLTGSTTAGRAVAATAGKHLKKSVLELGGSDAYIVLADADIDHAARICAHSRLLNSGQSCIAAKRFVVVDAVYDAFLTAFGKQMRAATMGDPMDEATTIGPMATHCLRDQLHNQVRTSIAAGAHCLFGGEVPDSPGAFYPPTVLVDVAAGMPAYDEELFGPVASVIRVADEAAAITVANDSPFGLGGAVFTRDRERGIRIAREQIDAGSCFVNDFVRSDLRLPFGGIKDSGYGRELSVFGIREFVNIKTISVKD